jgi:hypothetical protein
MTYLVYLAILLIACTIIYVFRVNYFKSLAIDIEPELLFTVLRPGTYTGTSTYSATELYNNGLICKHNVHIKREMDNNLHVTNNVTAYDAATNKLEYQGVRIVKFVYKPNHGNNLFKISQSHINGNMVSSSYGYASGKTANSISFNLSGSWHISNKDYTNIYNTITRTDKETIDTNFTHMSFIGLNEMGMDEKYTMISNN